VNWLICIAGEVASGKTTLAAALQAALPGSVRLAFGDVVRRHAAAARLEPTRRNLQDVGLQLVAAGWAAFVDELATGLDDHPGDDPDVVVVEGIRHREAVDALRERLQPRHCLLVYLHITDEQRRQRLAARVEAESNLRHEVEQHAPALRDTADLVLLGMQPADILVQRILERLSNTDDS
jgi:tRNA A37 N6-isopentenylltransferase MiaA